MSDELQVTELLHDPKWMVFPIQIGGEPHGGKIVVLRLQHPRYGNIDCQLNPETVVALCHGLQKAQHAIEGLPAPTVRMQ